MNRRIRIVLADDHALLRAGLRAFIEEQEGEATVISEATDGEEAIEQVELMRPDLLVLDLSMPGMGGIEATLELRRRGNRTPILVLTQYAEAVYLRRVMEAGANGYILKSARGEEFMAAVRAVVSGGTWVDPTLAGSMVSAALGTVQPTSDEDAYGRLSPREKQVLALVAGGASNKDMAQTLDLSVKTVMTHRANMMEKLGIHNRSKLVQFAIRTGLIGLDGEVLNGEGGLS